MVFKSEGMEISSSLKWKHIDGMEKFSRIIDMVTIRGAMTTDGALYLLGSSLYPITEDDGYRNAILKISEKDGCIDFYYIGVTNAIADIFQSYCHQWKKNNI